MDRNKDKGRGHGRGQVGDPGGAGPLEGDQHQRAGQVRDIARSVMDGDADDTEDANYKPEIAAMGSSVAHDHVVHHADKSHTHHTGHSDGSSSSHHYVAGADCPHCAGQGQGQGQSQGQGQRQ